MTKPLKRNVKDTVFTRMFADRRYIKMMCDALIPEKKIQEDEIEILTLQNVLMNGIHNDLGFTARGELIILCEAQSSWSQNIAGRMYFYLSETYKRYLEDQELSLFDQKSIQYPRPSLFVIYTGDRKDIPSQISITSSIFGIPSGTSDLFVQVISESTGKDIISQYIDFCRIQTFHARNHPNDPQEAAKLTWNDCLAKDVLTEFLTSREKELEDIMEFLFDQEEISRLYGKSQYRQGRAEGFQEGCEVGSQNKTREVFGTLLNLGMSESEICSILKITNEKYRELFKQRPNS
ncbi:MAG: hypothetical protein HUJ54_11485 [Erysipelotrichaceae bacterium]|nr:hypothetical protein [Erysipelotrichaceae bacterium]